MLKKRWVWFALGLLVAYVAVRVSEVHSTNPVGAFIDKLFHIGG